jgi:hypothetical protein
MFDSSKVVNEENKPFISSYISYGIQELKINSISINVAKTGSKQLVFNVEGVESKDKNFKGVDGAMGPVGKIFTMYMKKEQETSVVSILASIADSMGVRDKLNAIKSEDFDDYISQVSNVLKNKFANFAVGTDQYINNKGYSADKLKFLRYNFVEKVGTTPSTLQFDMNNKYHFKPAETPDNIGTPDSATFVKQDPNDLPF